MKFPWSKIETAPTKKRFVGLSQKPVIVSEMKPTKIEPTEEPKVAKKGERISPLQPYIAVVRDDIKTLLHIDDKRRKDKEVHDDFMEQYFGVKNERL